LNRRVNRRIYTPAKFGGEDEKEMLAITGGEVWTMTGSKYRPGVVLIDNGKVVAVGDNVEVLPGSEIIDAVGKVVMPGMIDAHTHVGIAEEIYRIEGEDLNEMVDPVTPQLRAIDAINPEDLAFQDALSAGITSLFSCPGSANVIGGQGLVMKTAGKVIDQMAIRNPAGLKVAFGENPKRVYGGQKKSPFTRMATAALLRETFVRAENYQNKRTRGGIDPDKTTDRDLGLEAVAQALRGEIPVRAHAHRADDIMTAIRVAEEFALNICIEHCTEGHKIADELARRGIPAVVGPGITNRSKVELKDRTLKTAGVLSKAGVKVALMTDHPVIPVQYLPLCAALAAREGMDEEAALKAITINAAEILGVADRIGSIAPGKDADLVILSGHPLEIGTKVVKVFVDGEERVIA